MKKVKKAVPKIKTEIIKHKQFEIKCPHCNTHLRGHGIFGMNISRIKCWRCKNPIELDWGNAVDVKDFHS